MQLREAVAEDAVDFDALRLRTWQAAYRGLVPDPFLDGLAVTATMTSARRERLRSCASLMHVAVEGGVLVGVAEACPARDADLDADAVTELAALYVDPASWGRGTGRVLLEAVLSRRPRPTQSLWVLESNAPARRFYERCGFVADGERLLRDLGAPLPEVRYLRRT